MGLLAGSVRLALGVGVRLLSLLVAIFASSLARILLRGLR